jgi:hypothetical protein
MSAQSPAPAGSLTIVDLTEGMDDLDVSIDEVDAGDEALKAVCPPAKKKKIRKGRRCGKGKKSKALMLSKLQEDKAEKDGEDDGMLTLFLRLESDLTRRSETFCKDVPPIYRTHLLTIDS